MENFFGNYHKTYEPIPKYSRQETSSHHSPSVGKSEDCIEDRSYTDFEWDFEPMVSSTNKDDKYQKTEGNVLVGWQLDAIPVFPSTSKNTDQAVFRNIPHSVTPLQQVVERKSLCHSPGDTKCIDAYERILHDIDSSDSESASPSSSPSYLLTIYPGDNYCDDFKKRYFKKYNAVSNTEAVLKTSFKLAEESSEVISVQASYSRSSVCEEKTPKNKIKNKRSISFKRAIICAFRKFACVSKPQETD